MKKIFVVDDERSILEAVEIMLVEEGYDVKTSSRGSSLLNLDHDLPDVIVLDVLLSGEDGRDIARKLKAQERTKNIPIVMISAHPSAQYAIKECGAEAFLPKPFDIQELLNVIEKYCTKDIN
jgi:DNA-binding response OmpR family regulator